MSSAMVRSNKKSSKLKPPSKSPMEIKTPSSLFEMEQRLMMDRAVASAKRHGINISPGERSSSDGNCAFQAALNNVNNRTCFKDKYPFSPDYYRRIWATDMKNRTSMILPGKFYQTKNGKQGGMRCSYLVSMKEVYSEIL